MSVNQQAPLRDIMHYESDIWSIADILYAHSIKQSDFPAYMMPFFALVMLEGRMRNAVKQIEEEYEITPETDPAEFEELFRLRDCGYNDFIVMQGKTLAKVCANDTSFEQDFHAYLNGFDADLKCLLGVDRGNSENKYLNMDGIVAELRGKQILMSVATKWSEIDLSGYDNSDITTLEEHIKRRWADISASTAGEQYTPNDIISLIAEIVGAKIEKPQTDIIHVYDPTCGGANLLFGVADRLKNNNGYKNVATYGSEYNDALYALAAIESRFRDFSTIKHGNTLTSVPFSDKAFDVIVANPPYGTKWADYKKAIENDQMGQFPGGLPAVSDGQLLFMQHILWQLDNCGMAVEVHNGSTLFDSGIGETNIRKYVFDHDWVEAIIQMTDNEFFNTPIKTYLWVMNKNKPEGRRDKVILIDGSRGWQLLKKSKGDKRREMLPEHRQAIVDALLAFRDSDISKVYDREYFYYNKQSLTLTELDDNNQALENDITLKNIQKVVLGNDEETITEINNLTPDAGKALKDKLKAYDYQEKSIDVYVSDDKFYRYDTGRDTILCFEDGMSRPLGCGNFNFDLVTSKGTKSLKVSLTKRFTSDYEIIPHHFNAEANKAEIDAFMQKYIFKPYTLGGNYVGVELNFNKEFYVPEKIEAVDDILKEIAELDEKLKEIEL